MRIRRLRFHVLLLALGVAVPLGAAEIVPMGDFRFLGGQYFFDNTPSSLSGNLSFTMVPAIKFSSRFSLIPTYLGSYRGSKEVNDLIGGGTLFQDEQNHLLSLKGVYAVTPAFKLKLGASYRVELLRETRDETWGKGLFDYRKLNFGVETEYAYSREHAVRLGVDLFTLDFPNYESLESSVTASGLGRELAGKSTLDCNNTMATVQFNDSFGRLKTELRGTLTAKDYPDQPLVLSDNSLSKEKRQDACTAFGLVLLYPFEKAAGDISIIPSLDCQLVLNDSTQAHYDANKYTYIADYYDYSYLMAGPSFTLLFGKNPWALTLGAACGRKDYKTRPVQDADGDYAARGEKIYVNELVYSLGAVYPLPGGLKLRVTGNFVDASSNMKYEKTFAYNYRSANYLFGFSYEF
jgi:hypothetical protein